MRLRRSRDLSKLYTCKCRRSSAVAAAYEKNCRALFYALDELEKRLTPNSRAACSLTLAIGKSTSMRRLQAAGIMALVWADSPAGRCRRRKSRDRCESSLCH